MLPKEFESEGALIFLVIYFIISIIAMYIICKDEEEQEEKKEEICGFEPNGSLNKNNKEKTSKEEKKITTPKRKSRYNKDNVLYIAYDFNILGNKSFAEINKIIEKRKIDKLTKDNFPAVRTTSVLFFNYSYAGSDFEDVILVRKNGSSISIKNLYDNPGYYIPKKYQKGFSLNNCVYPEGFSLEYDEEGMNNVSGLMHAIYAGFIRFKKEKEI